MDLRRYKQQLSKIFENLSSHLQPMNYIRTLTVSYGSCFRLPTVLTEPYFIWSFGPPENEYALETTAELSKQLRDKTVNSYEKHSADPVLNRVTFAKALDYTRKFLGLENQSFRPLGLPDAANLAGKSTSSGFPDYVKKSSIVEEATITAERLIFEGDDSFKDLPVTLSWRTQIRKSGIKYRLIWLVPFVIIIYEMMLFYPIIALITSLAVTSYCVGNVFPQLANRYNRLQEYEYIYSLDYESYDSSISPFFINLFFSFCKEHIGLSPTENWIFECVRRFHLNALVITGYEEEAYMFRKRNGLLSGSVITNFLGSFVNLFIICYFLLDHGISPVQGQISVMGDDCLFGLNDFYSMEYVTEYFEKKFGIKVSFKKSDIYSRGEPIYFLGAFIDGEKRYIDWELTKEQLKFTTSFNPDLSEFQRVHSKLCSSLFKYTDGYKYYLDEIPKLMEYFNVTDVPWNYLDMSTPSGGPIYERKLRSVFEFMYNGWRLQ